MPRYIIIKPLKNKHKEKILRATRRNDALLTSEECVK